MKRVSSYVRSPKKKIHTRDKGIRRAAKYSTLFIIGIIILAVSASTYAWYAYPHTADVSYQPCEIQYGKVITEWDGQNKEQWNKKDYHYQLREFSVRADAPRVFFPNTAEAEPTRIATGGKHDCDPEFTETVDIASEFYRWQGARVTGLRLGVPETSPVTTDTYLGQLPARSNTGLETPVFDIQHKAAAWVDDAGSATLISGEKQHEWWCINDSRCGNITKQPSDDNRPARGAGYQYTKDNCPAGVKCSDTWYKQRTLSKHVRDSNGLLKPFKIRLSAVSTYADTVGSAMVVAFKYPKETTIHTEVSGDNESILPGNSFSIELAMRKKGPATDSLTIMPATEDQSNVNTDPVELSKQQLKELNTADSVVLPMTFQLTESASPGSCHDFLLTIKNTEAISSLGTAKAAYCVAAVDTTFTYEVETRGGIDTDLTEFKTLVAETLRDHRGWAAANVAFERVQSGGDFTLWLSAADKMTSFSSGCDAIYSCRVGTNVIINNKRWQNATSTWNESGGSLRDYRHMVINHEVGHFLGLGHRGCPGANRPAPVMMQQSIALDGCRINPWPLPGEINRV